MRHRICIAALAVVLGTASLAQAQNYPPFFSATPTAYTAQISTAVAGPLLHAQATVSADHKYVNLNLQATNFGPPRFIPFNLTTAAPVGFVGTAAATQTPASGGVAPGQTASPGKGTVAAASPPANILDRPGMTLVAPLAPS